MSAIIISNNQSQFPFGAQTNMTIARLVSLNTMLRRLEAAIATASSGYQGVAGTQFETPHPAGALPNLFGVSATPTPGEAGAAYRYAMESLFAAWDTFWTTAKDNVLAIDNGQQTM